MFFRVLLSVFVLAASQAPDSPPQMPDLPAMLQNDQALDSFLIAYWPPPQKGWVQRFFVRGNGSVILQALPNREMAVTDVPTCTSQISIEGVRDLVSLLIAKRFLDLPERHFIFVYASQNPEELKIHSIGISDSHSKVRRSFGIGKFNGKVETIPDEFAAVENRLNEIWQKEFPPNSKECRFAPAIVF